MKTIVKRDKIIWTNDSSAIEELRESAEELYPDCPEDEIYEIMCEINAEYLSDERVTLDIQLKEPILVIADLGLWNGHRSGYKEIPSGNIRDCLYSQNDFTTWYVDRHGDMRCDDVHHDGINHYLYRVYRDGIPEERRDWLKDKIYAGKVTRLDIDRVTRRLGDEIGKVYGWTFPEHNTDRGEAR
jgi:hypothetical protein